jgi:hypothetical protein
LALGNDPAVPGNAENQNEQVSFPYASWLLFGKAKSPRGDMDLRRHSLFSCFDVPEHLLMRGHPQNAPAASHENHSYPRLLDFATGSKKYPRHPTVGCLYISHTRQIRSCRKRALPKIGDIQRTLSGIGSRSTDTTLEMESCTRTTGTSN